MNRTAAALLFIFAISVALWLGMRLADDEPLLKPGTGGWAPFSWGGSKPQPSGHHTTAEEEAVAPTGQGPVRYTSVETTSPVMPALSGSEKVEQWLTAGGDPAQGAVRVLQNWAKLKPEEQLPALGRVIHMLPDDRYQAAQRVLLDAKTSTEAKEVLFRDAFNRPAEVKLPVMLAVMFAPGHAQANEAHTALADHLGADYGANQSQWLIHIREELNRRAQASK